MTTAEPAGTWSADSLVRAHALSRPDSPAIHAADRARTWAELDEIGRAHV